MWILWNLCLVVSLSVSANSQKDVRKPPSITTGPDRDVTFMEDESVILKCKAEGIPTVTHEWKRNGEDLNLNHQNIIRGSDGDITIRVATRNDEGFYQCFAKNTYGKALSAVAHLQRAFLGKASTIISNRTVQDGHPFFIQAAMVNSFPTPTCKWETVTNPLDKYPRPFEESQRVMKAYNGDLHFAFAEKSDNLNGNIYSIIFSNPHTQLRVAGRYTRLTIREGPSPDFPPNISYSSKSREVALIGNSIALMCFFSGKPLPSISWSGPRNNLPFGRVSYSTYKTELKISKIIESDEGDYVCSAENSLGRFRQTLNIRVEAVPIFKQKFNGPHDVNVTEGATVTFNCSAFAIPEATIVWLWNGHPIDVNEAPYRFSFSKDLKSLTIRDVCRDCFDQERQTDLMAIQCNASNVHGYAFASGYLNVLLRTKATLLPSSTSISVDLAKENRFQFDCSATSDPSTQLTVQWYKMVDLGGRELVYNELPYLSVMNGTLTLRTEPNCSKTCYKYMGEYKCVANNNYTQDAVTVIFNSGNRPTTDPTTTPGGDISDYLNWIVIGIGVVLFLLLLILICCIVCQLRNRDEYDVDGKERKSGRNPEEELQANDFRDYFPSEYIERKGSAAPLGSANMFRSMDAIIEYDDDDVRNFQEDGSFVGKYSGDKHL